MLKLRDELGLSKSCVPIYLFIFMSCSKLGNLSRPKFPLMGMTDESYQVMNKGTNDITMK